jgi:hypothetical protein
MTEDSSSRLIEVRDAIRERLRGVCAHWPAELFDSMVTRLAQITLKYERQGSSSPYDRKSADHLLDDMKDTLRRSQAQRKPGETT